MKRKIFLLLVMGVFLATTLFGCSCSKKEEFTVTFDSNGGSSVTSQTVLKDDLVSKPTDPTKEGYIFDNWLLNDEPYDFSRPVTQNITLKASWIEETSAISYKVSFKIDDSVNIISVIEGKTVTKPTNPIKEGYDFIGWYNGDELFDFKTSIYSDITLVAKWEKVEQTSEATKYTVKFDSNGGTSVATQRVDEGNRATEPRDPRRSGYTFLGWYLNGRKFSFNTRIYEDITFEAKWEKDEVKYNTYCKIENDTYYSVSYVSDNKDTWNYSWNVRFYNLDNVKNLRVTEVGHLTTLSMYNKVYNVQYDKGMVMVGGDDRYSVAVTSGSMLRTYSLKSSNFIPSVGVPYKSNGDWYAKLSVRIKNYNNLNSYYASNLGSRIYFVPFYFEVEYTDLDNCVNDKASNSYKYDDYEIIDSYYR